MIEELGLKIYLTYEDPRYPTLVIQNDNADSIGYSLNLDTGELTKTCICAAKCDCECICSSWNYHRPVSKELEKAIDKALGIDRSKK